MTNLLVGLLNVLLSTNLPVAVSNAAEGAFVSPLSVVETNDPVEIEYRKLLEMDDASQAAADNMIHQEETFAAAGAPAPDGALGERIRARFAPVQKAYEDFLNRHPEHARAHLAFGSFLNDLQDEPRALAHWEKARQIDPKNPAAWNNLANYYGHNGPVTNAFVYYAKAIELNPSQAVYYRNLGSAVYLFRKDAMEYFQLGEQQVFDKVLDLYGRALRLDPKNFPLATDIGQAFYGVTPLRTNEALLAWNYALQVARDEIEREGISVHLARIQASMGQFDKARGLLSSVTNTLYAELKQRLLRSLVAQEADGRVTNAPSAKAGDSAKHPDQPGRR